MCAQRRLRSACAFAQADQSPCCAPEDALNPWLPRVPREDADQTANAQVDLRLRCAHMQSCRKYFAPAYFIVYECIVTYVIVFQRIGLAIIIYLSFLHNNI